MTSARIHVHPQNDGERLAALEQSVCNVESQVEKLDHKVDERFDTLGEQLATFIKSADEKYASKLTERIVYGLVSLVLMAVVTALIALVIV